MFTETRFKFIVPIIIFLLSVSVSAQKAGRACFGSETREAAKRSAKVWMPVAGYDPVLGYNPTEGPRRGAPPVNDAGLAAPIICMANPDTSPGKGTTPKFYCSVEGITDKDGDLIRYKVKPHFKGQSREKRNGEVYGEFLSSRFSKALGFFADDEWVADVTCRDCEKSVTRKFQGTPFEPFQAAAGIELPLGKGIDVNCDDKDASGLAQSFEDLLEGGADIAEIDAFKLWLAFIDHGDTKTDNQKFACLKTMRNPDGSLGCAAGQAVYYVSDMGSTFGFSGDSENKARLDRWKTKDPIKVNRKGQCTANAKSVGDTKISEEGRSLLAKGLMRLIEAEKAEGAITKVFRASRNSERDRPAEEWTTEFLRKASMIISARCSN